MAAPSWDTVRPAALQSSLVSPVLLGTSALADPAEGTLISCQHLSAASMALVMVCMQMTPVVWACSDGMHVLGAELAIHGSFRYSIARRWAEMMVPGAGAVTYLAGRALSGAHVYVAPVAFQPSSDIVATTPARRRALLSRGVGVAWLSVAALAGTAAYDLAAHAAFACSALRGDTGTIPDSALPGREATFRFGVTAVQSLVQSPADLLLAPTQLDAALGRCFQEGNFLSDLLLSDDTVDCEYLAEWAGQIGPPPMHELPTGILGRLPSFDTARFDMVAMPTIPAPHILPWLQRAPRQPPAPFGYCPRSPADLMPAWRWRGVERWLMMMLMDLTCIRDLGQDCERFRPPPKVFGQGILFEWARGMVWDFRGGGCGVSLDFQAPIEHTLNVDFFRGRLTNYPNQRILSFIVEGVRPLADVELQTVLVPHLMSLAKGFESVAKELRRMSSPELGWYSLHASFPFWPMYSLGEGAQPRKLEARWRRCEEGGAPRKDTFDEDGLRALSLNEASRLHHFPRHFAQDYRPEWLDYLRHRKLPASEAQQTAVLHNRGTKWERQRMPSLSDAMRALVVLKRAAFLLQEPIYLIGDDVKDFFNHLPHASEDLHKMNTIFLNADDIDDPKFSSTEGSLVFVHEKRMGFGIHPNSMIAQEFSEVLMHLLREDIDSVEDRLAEADPRESMQNYLQTRREVERRTGAHERRLYAALMYCDDSLLIVVGASRAIRVLRAWRRLVTDAGLIMAIPEKRTVGVWCTWIGALIFSTLGVIAVPRAKIIRATSAIKRLCSVGIEFGEYRSLMGLLEHVRCVTRFPKAYLHGLYAPHGADGEGSNGPNTLVHPNVMMSSQFSRLLDLLAAACGCVVANVLKRFEITVGQVTTFLTASDAATDSHPPGMGGFCHGFYWQFEVATEHLQWLHITVLELLACAFNVIITAKLLPPKARMLQLVDATAAFYTLTAESERSEVLMYAHHALLGCHDFVRSAERADLTHGAGDANIAGDAASRSEWDRLNALAAALKVRLSRVPLPPICANIYNDVLNFARDRGVRVKASRRPAPPDMPPSGRAFLEHLEMNLGKELSARIEMDGPSFASRLRESCGVEETTSAAPPAEARGSSSVTRQLNAKAASRASRDKPARGVVKRSGTAGAMTAIATPSQQPVPAPPHMPSRLIGGQRLAVPVFARTTAHHEGRRGQREAAVRRANRDRAKQMASSGATAEEIELIAQALDNAAAMTQLGAADDTLKKDDLAWSMWEEFNMAYGWDPVISRQLAVSFPDLLASRLGLFTLWVYPKIKGRRLPDANPRSVTSNYAGAVCRQLKRDFKLPVPRAATYEGETKGLLRGYKRIYGVLALAPKRRQPMKRSIWRRVEALRPGDKLAGRSDWMTDSHLDTVGCRVGRVLAETAHRLGEVVSYTPDEINYLVRSHVSFIIGGSIIVDPSRADLLRMAPGDTVLLAPCASKPDQFGERHCTFPSSLRYDGTPLCAAGALRAIELDFPCSGEARKSRPVFADASNQPFSYRVLNEWLHKLLVALVGNGVASTLSWHSFRIELACRLRAANCPDSTIQLICRWACPESVQTYAQIGIGQNIDWLAKAAKVQHDAVRTNNLPQLDSSEFFSEFEADHPRPQRTTADDGNDSGLADGLPATRDRVSVRWGDLWFDGVITSTNRGYSSTGQSAVVHHILYDAAHGFRPSKRVHALQDEDWRRI